MAARGLGIDGSGLAYTATTAASALMMVWAGVLGAGFGTSATSPSAFWAQLNGTRHLGGIKALVTAILVAGSALGPGLAGWLFAHGFDLTRQTLVIGLHSLDTGILASLAVLVLARRG